VLVGAGLLALVAAWFAFAQPPSHPSPRPSPTGPSALTYRTGGVTITVPVGWRVISAAPLGDAATVQFVDDPAQGTKAFEPILQLSNFDPSSVGGPACPDRVALVPPTGVVLFVQNVIGFEGEVTASPWPVRLDPAPTLPLPPNPCSGGRVLSWFTAGTVYTASVSIGPEATSAARAALVSAFASMTFAGAQISGNLTPTVTIGRVRVSGVTHEVGAYRGPTGRLCASLSGNDISCDLVPRPDQVVHVGGAGFLRASPVSFPVFVVGAVQDSVASVQVSFGGGRWVRAAIVPPPAPLQFHDRLFYVVASVPFTPFGFLNHPQPVRVLDARGRVIGRDTYEVRGG
jgi:hypothetical protein